MNVDVWGLIREGAPQVMASFGIVGGLALAMALVDRLVDMAYESVTFGVGMSGKWGGIVRMLRLGRRVGKVRMARTRERDEAQRLYKHVFEGDGAFSGPDNYQSGTNRYWSKHGQYGGRLGPGF